MDNETIKLGDFGLAYVAVDVSSSIKDMGSGTLIYMSNELINNTFKKDFMSLTKSDVWSAGCVLYELNVLEHLFNPKDNQIQVIRSIADFDVNSIKLTNIVSNSLLKM